MVDGQVQPGCVLCLHVLAATRLPEIHRGKERFPGMTITCALIRMVEKAAGKTGKAEIVTKAPVTKLIVSGGACTGSIYERGGATFEEF